MSRGTFQRTILPEDRGITTVKSARALRLSSILVTATHILMVALLAVPSLTQEKDQESATTQEQRGYPVAVDGYEIFRVHERLGAA